MFYTNDKNKKKTFPGIQRNFRKGNLFMFLFDFFFKFYTETFIGSVKLNNIIS